MICPKCGAPLKCVDSRQKGGYRWRRYRCTVCGWLEKTREYPEWKWREMVKKYRNSIK